MTAPGRIPCVNPRCRRTASREKHPDWNVMICRKCWRALPTSITQRIRELERRGRRLQTLIKRRFRRGTLSSDTAIGLGDRIDELLREQWSKVERYYVRPDKPAGLEGFLEEVGLA
jgi:hypothetical protein